MSFPVVSGSGAGTAGAAEADDARVHATGEAQTCHLNLQCFLGY